MADESDWRLCGQQRWLAGVTLIHRAYRQNPSNPNWDHDHCEFCHDELCLIDHDGTKHVGYATEDDYYWVCEDCFADLKDQFQWIVIEALG